VHNTLWNVYAFLANYARLDGFDPTAEPVPLEERQPIDRWLLSNLQLLVQRAHDSMRSYLLYGFVEQAERFIDDLSNWYVRRNRRRFWRTKDEADRDKLGAYQTLYTALETLCRVIAPICPFVTERIYQNLVRKARPDAPESIHLCEFPQADPALIDEDLSKQMDAVKDLVSMALGVRQARQLRVRQPLAEMTVAAADAAIRAGIERFPSHVLEELNVKRLVVREDLGDAVSATVKPDFGKLGPRLGKSAGNAAKALGELDPDEVARTLDADGRIELTLDGEAVTLLSDDVIVERQWRDGIAGADGPAFSVALDTVLTDELTAEGWARDVVRHVQQLRKDAKLEMSDRIRLRYDTSSESLAAAIDTWSDYVRAETLALDIARGLADEPDRVATIGGAELKLSLVEV
jgi:isoleucyl-tRNA synthetase